MLRFTSSRAGALAALMIVAASRARAAAVPVVFGTSWDGPSSTLQSVVTARYGAGMVQCTSDYIGSRDSDPDPFFWVDGSFSALIIRGIAGNANLNIVASYLDPATGATPVIDGVDDGVIFDGPASAGATALVSFSGPARSFGFYLNPNGPGDAINAPEPEVFFTNRHFNDLGPDGHGAIHAPYDGDVQALVYDISACTQPNTWLVCFEDLDSGANPGPCCATTDNDFNDFVFEVHAVGVTPARPLSFGGLKIRYR